jgi:hypothetical protein
MEDTSMVHITSADMESVYNSVYIIDGLKDVMDLFCDSLSDYTDMNDVGRLLHEKTTHTVELARICLGTAAKTLNDVLYEKATRKWHDEEDEETAIAE